MADASLACSHLQRVVAAGQGLFLAVGLLAGALRACAPCDPSQALLCDSSQALPCDPSPALQLAASSRNLPLACAPHFLLDAAAMVFYITQHTAACWQEGAAQRSV